MKMEMPRRDEKPLKSPEDKAAERKTIRWGLGAAGAGVALGGLVGNVDSANPFKERELFAPESVSYVPKVPEGSNPKNMETVRVELDGEISTFEIPKNMSGIDDE